MSVRVILLRAALAILVLVVGLPASVQAQSLPPWLQTAIGLDTVRAPVADWVVTDSAARAAVLEAFAPEGPWLFHRPYEGREAYQEKLDAWPSGPTAVDLSGDGVPDVMLTLGRWEYAWLEGRRLVFRSSYGTNPMGWFHLYQWIDGEFVEIAEWTPRAYLAGMLRARPWDPATLQVVFSECCWAWAMSYYEPVLRGDTVRYRRTLDVLPVNPRLGGVDAVFESPRPFVVENAVYSLRQSPEIGSRRPYNPTSDDWFGWSPALAELEEPWEFDGTRIALYEEGAHGVALASATDDTGRVWWYVLMSPHTPPMEPVFQTPVSLGGWMSSRFLREVGRVADAPPGQDPPPELPEPR